MHFDFHWQIYLLNYLFGNFWYFFMHKFNWFPQSKILCFWMFILFIYSACVSVTYFHVCSCIQLYFVYVCCVSVPDFFVPMLVCICVRLSVFVFTILCKSLYQLSNELEYYNSLKLVSNFLEKEESVPPDSFSRESKPYCKT